MKLSNFLSSTPILMRLTEFVNAYVYVKTTEKVFVEFHFNSRKLRGEVYIICAKRAQCCLGSEDLFSLHRLARNENNVNFAPQFSGVKVKFHKNFFCRFYMHLCINKFRKPH